MLRWSPMTLRLSSMTHAIASSSRGRSPTGISWLAWMFCEERRRSCGWCPRPAGTGTLPFGQHWRMLLSEPMRPYYQDQYITIYQGDCLEILPQLLTTVDVVITDPPYGIT